MRYNIFTQPHIHNLGADISGYENTSRILGIPLRCSTLFRSTRRKQYVHPISDCVVHPSGVEAGRKNRDSS